MVFSVHATPSVRMCVLVLLIEDQNTHLTKNEDVWDMETSWLV